MIKKIITNILNDYIFVRFCACLVSKVQDVLCPCADRIVVMWFDIYTFV